MSPDVIFDVLRGIALVVLFGAVVSAVGILALKWGGRRKERRDV